MRTDKVSHTAIAEPDMIVSQQRDTFPQQRQERRFQPNLHYIMWVGLILACLGASWFAYQYFLVPQPATFAPHWEDAHWVQAVDGNAPVAYFRYVTTLDAPPDGAFVTVAASQVFRLYVNGTFLGANSLDFVQGDLPRAYMYDIADLLQPGPNVIALRVANEDQQPPSLRVSLGIVRGNTIHYYGTGAGWQATAQSALAHPRFASNANVWTTNNFDATSWPPIQTSAGLAISPLLTVNPLLYEQPIPAHWMSIGIGHDAYFVRQFSMPAGMSGAWLRLVASGTANVFINGHLFMVWNGQAPVMLQNVDQYLSETDIIAEYRIGLTLGIYAISPYLHTGVNTIAVHVAAPGDSAARVGLDTLNASMALDVLISDAHGHSAWFPSDENWHGSPRSVEGWTQGSNTALAWSLPISVARPGASRTFYLPDSNTPRNIQFVPPLLVCELLLVSIGTVLGLSLLMGLLVIRRFCRSHREALELTSLAYLPALAFEGLLIALSLEPQIPQPFPYTWVWGLVLLMLVGVGYLLLWRHAQLGLTPARGGPTLGITTFPGGAMKAGGLTPTRGVTTFHRTLAWLRVHWALVLLMLLAIPLICYNPAYEPYWQDELTSYYAAKGILAHGLPFLPSGFLYLKGELYSYLLALSIALFGDQSGTPRIISMVEYLVSLPLLYGVGCYFFNRRVALLATAMLAFSPFALLWGHQMRMYEQAQVLTLLVAYLFYKAVQQPQSTRRVYLAVACLIAMYLSHEEAFIILPALVLCVLVASAMTTNRQGILPMRLPAVLYQKPWWYAAAIGVSIIALQLLAVRLFHPPILGTDQSQRPLIQLTTENIPYYIYLLFFPWMLGHATLPVITLNSLLASAGCVLALRRSDRRAMYCALLLLISLLTLVFIFTLTSDRYIYPLLPLYYLMGAYALLVGLDTLWTFARSRLALRQQESVMEQQEDMVHQSPTPSWSMRMIVALTLGLVCVCVLVVPMLPISDYNLSVSRATGLAYQRHYPDYDAVGQYMQRHWQKGDIVIAVSPAISILYYVGHVDYFFSLDRALYLFEQNGRITDTPTGSNPLLSQEDFQAVVAAHARIWIISDNNLYQSAVTKDNRFVFPPDFHLVFEGYQSAIYFRGS